MGEAPSLLLRQQRASAPAHGRHPVGKDSDGSSPSRSGSGPSTAKGHAGALAPSLHCRAQQGGPLWKPQRRQQTQERRRGAPARGRPRRARGAPWKVDGNATFSGREARRCLWMPDLPAFILGRLFFFPHRENCPKIYFEPQKTPSSQSNPEKEQSRMQRVS